ncbi:MAG TPA: hypothetical protein VFG86_03335 [Chloroflexota bacterium]|jgi:hypothetical protein|nr:hypothetical protein [Chloroflexota bacterium]
MLDGELALITRQARRDLSAKPSRFRVSLPLRPYLTRLTSALAVAAQPEDAVWPVLHDYPYGNLHSAT